MLSLRLFTLKLMRILEVDLLTPDLAATARFYSEVLALPVAANEGSVAVMVGYSRLRFRAAAPGAAPFYHVAFALDFNHLLAAHEWLAARVPLLPGPAGGTLVDFPNWNAQSFYFHDATGNILECIARRGSLPSSAGSGLAGMLRGVSEVGAAVPDVPAAAELLHRTGGVPYYPPGPRLPHFTPLGDDHGLFILSAVGRGWMPTGRPAEQHVLRAVVEQSGQQLAVQFSGQGSLPTVTALPA
ncbi:VOC family protein [Hymenobacter weizhouensis]|uniref:VOC family protein n=1 Tax=Hymenobacter sp. YIM 151500-1 TaxID=2987689 RepID=UPI002227C58F|nr:hypothetical protein [Hymenobacter sp. YIM 151500-1]UYZ64471.1 hypothetical protein OIS53_06380 [Hymenobacter sp. YIM 151500-1]